MPKVEINNIDLMSFFDKKGNVQEVKGVTLKESVNSLIKEVGELPIDGAKSTLVEDLVENLNPLFDRLEHKDRSDNRPGQRGDYTGDESKVAKRNNRVANFSDILVEALASDVEYSNLEKEALSGLPDIFTDKFKKMDLGGIIAGEEAYTDGANPVMNLSGVTEGGTSTDGGPVMNLEGNMSDESVSTDATLYHLVSATTTEEPVYVADANRGDGNNVVYAVSPSLSNTKGAAPDLVHAVSPSLSDTKGAAPDLVYDVPDEVPTSQGVGNSKADSSSTQKGSTHFTYEVPTSQGVGNSKADSSSTQKGAAPIYVVPNADATAQEGTANRGVYEVADTDTTPPLPRPVIAKSGPDVLVSGPRAEMSQETLDYEKKSMNASQSQGTGSPEVVGRHTAKVVEAMGKGRGGDGPDQER